MPDIPIKTFDVTVTAREGGSETRPAQLLCCVRCDDDEIEPTTFIVYSINDHLHLQCNRCSETYCRAGGACN